MSSVSQIFSWTKQTLTGTTQTVTNTFSEGCKVITTAITTFSSFNPTSSTERPITSHNIVQVKENDAPDVGTSGSRIGDESPPELNYTELFTSANQKTVQKFLDQMDMEGLNVLFQDLDIPSNVQLKFSNGTLHLNKQLLSLYSPVFKSMFDTRFNALQEVDLSEIDREVFVDCFSFLFFQQPINISHENALAILHLADYLNLTSINQDCEEWLLANLSTMEGLQESIHDLHLPNLEKLISEEASKRATIIFERIINGEKEDSLRHQLEGYLPFIILHCPTTAHLQYIVENFPNISKLSLRNAREITNLIPLTKLATLQYLDLSNTKIADDDITHIIHLTTLKHLNLQKTKITNDSLGIISNLTALEHLNLCKTLIDFAGTGLMSLANLTALRHLNLSRTKIRNHNHGLAPIANLTALQYLDLSGTLLWAHGDIFHIANLTSLEHLDLSDTEVNLINRLGIRGETVIKTVLASLTGLTALKFLNLNNTKITDESLVYIANLTGLQHLDLGRTQITDTSIDYIANLTSLQQLDLCGTQITDTGLARIANLLNLQREDP